MTYEYKLIEFYHDPYDTSKMERTLNELGRKGWRVVYAEPYYRRAMFMREFE